MVIKTSLVKHCCHYEFLIYLDLTYACVRIWVSEFDDLGFQGMTCSKKFVPKMCSHQKIGQSETQKSP